MINRVVIPQMFENMEEATIGEWRLAVGDAFTVGDVLCELITEKATFELEAETAGTLRAIVAPVKAIAPVGYIIALTGDADDAVPDVAAENLAVIERKAQGVETESVTGGLVVPAVAPATPAAAPATGGGGSRVRATPAARRAARERNVNIEDVASAFPGKVLSEEDVARFANER